MVKRFFDWCRAQLAASRAEFGLEPEVTPIRFVTIEQGIEEYFTNADALEAMLIFARVREILIGRKLVRKERSDKGVPRVGKLGMRSDVTPEIASQSVARALVDAAIRDYRTGDQA